MNLCLTMIQQVCEFICLFLLKLERVRMIDYLWNATDADLNKPVTIPSDPILIVCIIFFFKVKTDEQFGC